MKKFLFMAFVALTVFSFMFVFASCGCDHQWEEATCTNARTCQLCGEVDGEPLGHTEVTVDAITATCTVEGLTEWKYCSVCKEILVEQVIIPKASHNIKYGVCTECYEVSDAYEALVHYILDNGKTGKNSDKCIEYTLSRTSSSLTTVSMSTNSNASVIEFCLITEDMSSTVSLMIELNPNSSMHNISGDFVSLSTESIGTGKIDGSSFSKTNSYIYNFNYSDNIDNDYYSQRIGDTVKSSMETGADLILKSVKEVLLPGYITMEMLGFDNY